MLGPIKNQDIELSEPFSLQNQSNHYYATQNKEFVITGSLVWEEEVILREPKIGEPSVQAIMYSTDPKQPHRMLAFAHSPYDAPPLGKASCNTRIISIATGVTL